MDFGINHIFDFSNYDLSVTPAAAYRDEQGTNFLFLEDTIADSYVTLNLEATLMPHNAAWALSFYMRNVTDERFLTDNNINNRGLTYGIYNPPQTYGVRLLVDFQVFRNKDQ